MTMFIAYEVAPSVDADARARSVIEATGATAVYTRHNALTGRTVAKYEDVDPDAARALGLRVVQASTLRDIEAAWTVAKASSNLAECMANALGYRDEDMGRVADTAWRQFYAACTAARRCPACWDLITRCECI